MKLHPAGLTIGAAGFPRLVRSALHLRRRIKLQSFGRRRGPDPWVVEKCGAALGVAERSRTVHEGLYAAYCEHLHWCEPGQFPDALRRRFVELRNALCRAPRAIAIASDDIRVRELDEISARRLLQDLRDLRLELERLR